MTGESLDAGRHAVSDEIMEERGKRLFEYLSGVVPPPDDNETSRPSPLLCESIDPDTFDERNGESGEEKP